MDNIFDQFDQSPNPADPNQYPEAGGAGNFMAGVGKAFHDLSQGYLQLLGDLGQAPQIPRQDVDAQRAADAPLMNTPSGKAGDVVGNVVATAPLAFVPGVNTLPGALAAGAAYGAAEPVGTNDSRGRNAATSAALFATVPLATTALRAGKALVEPLYQGGREAIVGRTLAKFVGDDPQALAALQNPESFVSGSAPTAADATGNAGLAMLESGATGRDPLVKQAFAQRLAANNSARADALRGIAGDADKMAFFKASRDATAQDLYDTAFGEAPADTPWIKGQLTQLFKRPAFVRAIKQGQEDAMNMGIPVSIENPEHATQILHFTKQALEDQISKEIAAGGSARGLQDTRDILLSLMESKDFSPSYRLARDTYAKMSQPINQMEIGRALYDKMVPALNDFGGTARTRASAYADALRNADATAARATGFSGAKMANIMSPDQMETITNVAKDLSRRAATEDAMRGIGSNTAQNLAAQNFIDAAFGPLGISQTTGQNFLKNLISVPYLGGAIEFGTKGAESAIQRELANALLDPQRAAQLMSQVAPGARRNFLAGLIKYAPATRPGVIAANGSQ